MQSSKKNTNNHQANLAKIVNFKLISLRISITEYYHNTIMKLIMDDHLTSGIYTRSMGLTNRACLNWKKIGGKSKKK